MRKGIHVKNEGQEFWVFNPKKIEWWKAIAANSQSRVKILEERK